MAGLSAEALEPIAEIYSADVKAKYQSSQRLQGIMPEVSNNGGGVRHDWIGSTLEMTQTPFGAAEIDTASVSFDPVVTKPLRFVIKTAIAEADQSLTNVNLQRAHSQMHGMAAARTVDILKLRAIFDNPDLPINDFVNVARTVGPNTGLNSTKFNAMATALNNADVDLQQRSIIANSDQYQSLLNDERYTNFFYNTDKTLPGYDLKMFSGLQPRMLGKDSTNAIDVTPNGANFDSYAFALQFEAMQFMYNIPMRTVITWDGANLNYVIVTELVANAQVLQKAGIVIADLKLNADGQPIVNPTV